MPFLGLTFTFVRCPTCGLVYQNPLLDAESRRHLYGCKAYWSHRGNGSADADMLNYYDYVGSIRHRMSNNLIRLKWMRDVLSPGCRVLDLGCSDGLLVKMLGAQGCNASGLDISEPMIDYGKKAHEADLHAGDFADPWPFDENFDVITCFATLSNMINPSRVFTRIAENLKPGGHLFFNFGDYRRVVSRMLGRRLYLFRPSAATIYSRRTVEAYCRESGLKLVRVFRDMQVVPIARLLGFMRMPVLMGTMKRLGLEDVHARIPLPSGCAAHAVREDS